MSCSKMASSQGHSRETMQLANGHQTKIVTNIFKKVGNMILTNSSVHTHANHHEPHKKRCSVHEDRSVDFLCVPCDADICQLCKMSEHEGHETKSVSLAAEEAKGIWTSVFCSRIKQHEQTLKNTIEETKVQMEDLMQTARATESKINERCGHLQSAIGINSPETSTQLAEMFEQRFLPSAQSMEQQNRPSELNFEESTLAVRLRQDMLLDMMNKQKEQQLEQLKAMKNEASSELEACIKDMEEELESTVQQRETMDVAFNGKDHVSILNLRRQAEADFSTEQLKRRLHKVSPAYRYMVYHETDENVDLDDMISDMLWNDHQKEVVESYFHDFIGHAKKKRVPARKGVEGIAVQLKPAFRCSEETHAFVKSICPRSDERMMVSFSASPSEEEGITKTFDVSGEELELHSFGLASLKTILDSEEDEVSVHFQPAESECSSVSTLMHRSAYLYAKNGKNLKLVTDNDGTDYFFKFYMLHLDKKANARQEFWKTFSFSNKDILTTTNFDVSKFPDRYAMVNIILKSSYNSHGFRDGFQCTRELFILHDELFEESTCYTYRPPTPQFSPTDVCFFDVNGEEVLAVADEGTNSIHLSCWSSDSGKYVFVKYLVDGHPFLTCPTALNTDTWGRLWVACKGGHLLIAEVMFSETERHSDADSEDEVSD